MSLPESHGFGFDYFRQSRPGPIPAASDRLTTVVLVTGIEEWLSTGNSTTRPMECSESQVMCDSLCISEQVFPGELWPWQVQGASGAQWSMAVASTSQVGGPGRRCRRFALCSFRRVALRSAGPSSPVSPSFGAGLGAQQQLVSLTFL